MIELVTGGARSGKSRFAQAEATRLGGRIGYIATAQAFDEEMRARIQKHRQDRPATWRTFEGHRDLAEFLFRNPEIDTWLLDCVTLWITGLMFDLGGEWMQPASERVEQAEKLVAAQVQALLQAAEKREKHLILVTNEVGMGLVPESAFGRIFRDIAGRANQRIAARADAVYFMVSGIPLQIKGAQR